MNILALDTSTDACSVALLMGETVIEDFIVAPQQHAQLLLPMIDKLLADNPVELDAIAFGRGPGSFTGLRIAASVTQAIAFSKNLPVIPVSTLHAIAYNVFKKTGYRTICAHLDARMGEIYYGIFEVQNEELVLVGEEQLGQLPPGEWFLASDYPHASDIALLARKEKMVTAEQAIPIYLRNNVVTLR
ncbi:MAG: tRNA (adenosine(37)-N6)-threonylcarbamoyltransferase complex dimerization subunit type 1 TsaB [Gammaproteobacteria bacterium]